jgi:hypothetical protein
MGNISEEGKKEPTIDKTGRRIWFDKKYIKLIKSKLK